MQFGEMEKQNISSVLDERGVYVSTCVGVSMLPMLKNRRDTVVIKKKSGRLSRLDVALYKRDNDYVLHRVIALTDDGYVIRGDNCYEDELVQESAVIGVLSEFYRGEKHFLCSNKKYLKYAEKRVKTFARRKWFFKVKCKIKSLFTKRK